jgi:hypothetical protein
MPCPGGRLAVGEFHPQGECGGDCSGCCNEAELNS